MDNQPRPKRNTDTVITSDPKPDANRGDEEKFKSHRYFANKVKGFTESVKKLFGK